jgi:hypothetical protein
MAKVAIYLRVASPLRYPKKQAENGAMGATMFYDATKQI